MHHSAEAKADDSSENLELLQKLKTEVFDNSDEKLALAMGRPVEEIQAWFDGSEEIDDDAGMKIHGLVEERLSDE